MKRLLSYAFILLNLTGLFAMSSSAQAATTDGAWSFCASENGQCIFTGTQNVRYGSGSTFVTQSLSWGATCNNGAFGTDPTPGVAKHCEVSNSWAQCAGENGSCNFGDTETVRFGAGSTYYAQVATGGIACNTGVFGDPVFGTVKHCDSTPTTWTLCANENGQCNFGGSQVVLYGANGHFITATRNGPITCNNATLGNDPISGTAKSCYVPGLPVATGGNAPVTQNKSGKRGLAYDLATPGDIAAISRGASWWYNWNDRPNGGVGADYQSRYGMEFIPMLWNGNFNDAAEVAYLRANPSIKYLLVMNEPNLTGQSNYTPDQAAVIWPRYEAIAAQTGVKIVGPAITWGTMQGYTDPVVWMDAFYTAYQNRNGGRNPQIDYLAFHWYDYGLGAQLDRLTKYGKQFWVTEFANWHTGDGSAQIDSVAKQEAQMADMVNTLETRSDVFRYSWFTGRWNPDPHFDSTLGADGVTTDLGTQYLSQPWH